MTMAEYIFYTSEGFTQAPSGNEVENCQVLGIALGENEKEAEHNLLKENPWIKETGFDTTHFIVKQLFTGKAGSERLEHNTRSLSLQNKEMEKVTIFEAVSFEPCYLSAINHLLGQLSSQDKRITAQELEELIVSDNSHLFFLQCGSMIVGMTTVGVYHIPSGKRAWIEDVVVDSCFRGRSFGKMLVEYAIRYVRSLGGCTLMLTSRPSRIVANAMYSSLGFDRKQTNVYRMGLDDGD